MIWRKYRNSQLAIHVEQRNRHNKIVNELASACVTSLAEFSNQKIQNVDGGISKKIRDKLFSVLNALHPHTRDLQWTIRPTEFRIYLWVKSCYQVEGVTFYIQGEVCVGDLVGDFRCDRSLNRTRVYVPRKEVTLLETNFDAGVVLAALSEMDSIEDRLNNLKSHLSDFIMQRD